jgi:hypothetical protein
MATRDHDFRVHVERVSPPQILFGFPAIPRILGA